MTAWIKPAMGLRVVLSTVDHARLDPSYTLIYSSWLPSSRLVAAISVALSKAGWNLGLACANSRVPRDAPYEASEGGGHAGARDRRAHLKSYDQPSARGQCYQHPDGSRHA